MDEKANEKKDTDPLKNVENIGQLFKTVHKQALKEAEKVQKEHKKAFAEMEKTGKWPKNSKSKDLFKFNPIF